VIEPFKDIEDARALAQAIVDTVREPLLVLDGNLRVLAVSRSYYLTFRVDRQDVLGRPYVLGDGQWHIPALRTLLEKIIPERAAMDAFEVEHEFPVIGRRIMLLNARAVFYADHSQTTLLLAFEDVTERRAIEREKAELLRQTEGLLQQKDMLLRELEHRVANSLQIIASILMLKARTVTSDETRQHLQDAHQRVMALAAVQGHLHASEHYDLAVGAEAPSLLAGLIVDAGGNRMTPTHAQRKPSDTATKRRRRSISTVPAAFWPPHQPRICWYRYPPASPSTYRAKQGPSGSQQVWSRTISSANESRRSRVKARDKW
jgi:hypothetical protein